MKHDFPKHRYKYGKQSKAIDLDGFAKMLDKVGKIKLPPRMRERYDNLTIRSFLSVLYWTGLRKTEIIGAKSHRYVLPPCPDHAEPIVKYTEEVTGILREDIKIVDKDILVIYAIARKHGRRDAPLEFWTGLPFIDLIIKQWKRTPEGGRVWAISEWDGTYLMNQIDAKKYVHFFRFNRITELCVDPEMSVGEICNWSGLTVQTVESYLERSGRLIKSTREKMKKRFQKFENS